MFGCPYSSCALTPFSMSLLSLPSPSVTCCPSISFTLPLLYPRLTSSSSLPLCSFLLPSSFFSGQSPKADGPHKQMLPTQSLEKGKKKQRLALKQTKSVWRVPSRQVGKFTVQLILDVTEGLAFPPTGRETKHTGGRRENKIYQPERFLSLWVPSCCDGGHLTCARSDSWQKTETIHQPR